MSTPGSFGAVREKKKKDAEGAKPAKVRKKLPGPFHESLKLAEGEGQQLEGNVPESLEKSWAQWKNIQKLSQSQDTGNSATAGSDNEDSEGEGYMESDPFGFENRAASATESASQAQKDPPAPTPKSAPSAQSNGMASEPNSQALNSPSAQKPGPVADSFARAWPVASGSSAVVAGYPYDASNLHGVVPGSTHHGSPVPNAWNESESSFSPADTAAPSIWESAEDPGSGCIYYFNRSTGERTWECPEEVLALTHALEQVQSAAEAEMGTKLGPEAIAAALLAKPRASQPAPVVLPPVSLPVLNVDMVKPKSSLPYPQLGPKVVPPPGSVVVPPPMFTAPLESKASASAGRPGLGPAAARLAALADAVTQGRRSQ